MIICLVNLSINSRVCFSIRLIYSARARTCMHLLRICFQACTHPTRQTALVQMFTSAPFRV